ncbi:MAG: hypothetical protein JO111_09670 [Caulobacteraceae bacterium]|nr:hypothetical protein [Caulobacteraceae bacterium]
MLAEAPPELLEAVLAEEGLAHKDDHRHAPVTAGALGALVLLDHGVQTLGFLVDSF